MYTIDSSVWVNATEPLETDHADSRRLLSLLHARAIPLVLPTLVLVEVSGTVRRIRNETRAQRITRILGRWQAATFVALDQHDAELAAQFARTYRLRGADAVYAAVTERNGTTLISRDGEHLTRLAGFVPVLHPTAALAALTSSLP